ncbi:hypothetical protein B0H13DRAFT_2520970 [Mycena leptocephala]|nr:hypothetical protein B0H13DRAFT_2520970 [Mycena leptocephala]
MCPQEWDEYHRRVLSAEFQKGSDLSFHVPQGGRPVTGLGTTAGSQSGADATYSRTCPVVIPLIEIVYACVDAFFRCTGVGQCGLPLFRLAAECLDVGVFSEIGSRYCGGEKDGQRCHHLVLDVEASLLQLIPALSCPHRSPTSLSSFLYLCPLPDPTSTLSLPSRFTNTLSLFSPSSRKMRRSSRRPVAARHRRPAMVDHRQAYVDVQPVKSRGATAASVPAQDVQSGTISSPRAHPLPHSSRLHRPTSLRITEDRAEKAVGWRSTLPHSFLSWYRSPTSMFPSSGCASPPLSAPILPPHHPSLVIVFISSSSSVSPFRPVVAVVLQDVNVKSAPRPPSSKCDLQASGAPSRTECLLETIPYPAPRMYPPRPPCTSTPAFGACLHRPRYLEIAEDGRYPTYVTVTSPCTDTLRVFTKTIRVILQLARSVHPSQKHQGADVSSVHKSRNVDGMPPRCTGVGGGRGRREALWCAVHNALDMEDLSPASSAPRDTPVKSSIITFRLL